MIGSQKFSEDLRYIVEVSVNIDNIDISLGSQQLSKLMFCVQHFYEYGLNIVKNGQKNYSFTK